MGNSSSFSFFLLGCEGNCLFFISNTHTHTHIFFWDVWYLFKYLLARNDKDNKDGEGKNMENLWGKLKEMIWYSIGGVRGMERKGRYVNTRTHPFWTSDAAKRTIFFFNWIFRKNRKNRRKSIILPQHQDDNNNNNNKTIIIFSCWIINAAFSIFLLPIFRRLFFLFLGNSCFSFGVFLSLKRKIRNELLLMICGSTLTTNSPPPPLTMPPIFLLIFWPPTISSKMIMPLSSGRGGLSIHFPQTPPTTSLWKNDYCYVLCFCPQTMLSHVVVVVVISNHILIFLLSAITHSQTHTTHPPPTSLFFLLWRLS